MTMMGTIGLGAITPRARFAGFFSIHKNEWGRKHRFFFITYLPTWGFPGATGSYGLCLETGPTGTVHLSKFTGFNEENN